MDDTEFKDVIFSVAEELIQRDLTTNEKQDIIKVFNTQQGNAYIRVKNAMKVVLGEDVIERVMMLESEGANNNWANIIAELKKSADAWAKK